MTRDQPVSAGNPRAATTASEPEAVLLCQIPGMNAALLRRLLSRWTAADTILRAPSSELRALGVPPALISRIVAAPRQLAATIAGLKSLDRMGIASMTYLSPLYPQRLRDLDDPPLLLHIQGRWPPPEPSVALLASDQSREDEHAQTLRQFLDRLRDLGVAILVGADDLALVSPAGSICVLGYGALLARSRITEPVRTTVQNGEATLVSVVPVNGQSTPASETLALAVRTALCDGILLAAGNVPSPLEIRPAAFRWALASPTNIAADHFIPLKADESGIRRIAHALGVHRTGTTTVQQERLW